jgi:hypothetical protein
LRFWFSPKKREKQKHLWKSALSFVSFLWANKENENKKLIFSFLNIYFVEKQQFLFE